MNSKNIILIVFFVLAIIGASFLFYDFSEYPEADKLPINEPPIKKIPPSVIYDKTGEYEELTFPDNTLDTSDWQMYQTSDFDKNIAFEIRYPKNWKIKSHGENQQGSEAHMVIYDKRSGDGADNGIYMTVEKIPIEKYISKSAESLEYRKININNAYGYAFFSKTKSSFLATSVILRNIKGDRTYTFYILGPDLKNPSNHGYYLDVLEQILLSFKLIQ